MPKKKTTNADFARESKPFIAACKAAKVKPTARQASKYRRKKGIAWAHKHLVVNPEG